jgi:hypothetical protein
LWLSKTIEIGGRSSNSIAGCRTRSLGVHRIGQDIPGGGLNQERRVANERDDGVGAIEDRRAVARLVDTRGPRRPSREQHSGHCREWLPRHAIGIDEPLAVEMIALHSRHGTQAGSRSNRDDNSVGRAYRARSLCTCPVVHTTSPRKRTVEYRVAAANALNADITVHHNR